MSYKEVFLVYQSDGYHKEVIYVCSTEELAKSLVEKLGSNYFQTCEQVDDIPFSKFDIPKNCIAGPVRTFEVDSFAKGARP